VLDGKLIDLGKTSIRFKTQLDLIVYPTLSAISFLIPAELIPIK
tara:strand:- start:427 stop:558 length:132 start_codon:yes stop_codon:yes gene_type:complete